MLFMLFTGSGALADETLQISIPVISFGHDCTAELYDQGGHRVQFLKLDEGTESAFTVTCTGLKRFSYTALVADTDTENVSFDRRNYRITMDIIYDTDEQLSALVFIEDLVAGERKMPRLEFTHTVQQPTPPPTPAPTPSPVPTATPVPYHHKFSFTKRWRGDREESIDWVLYNADGTQRHKLFNKHVISKSEWYYEAYFENSADDCYVIEVPPEGYVVYYENVGIYSDVTDRCHNGGTIINHKIPQTSDDTNLNIYVLLILLSAIGIVLCRRIITAHRRS